MEHLFHPEVLKALNCFLRQVIGSLGQLPRMSESSMTHNSSFSNRLMVM
ncbi:hypothetical protein FGIG_11176 [Fasciola gigantica]|uniref:Uncharacterized protein n=1 Tax=Fasciola gigantica TaxID=46835 RepID=A0A504YDW9_FASGI|nr:hypothetical protein FGIG_11176 [Fasciola gigantica]